MPFPCRLAAAIAAVWLASVPAAAEPAVTHPPSQINFSMLFTADVRDSPECDVHVDGRRITYGANVTNPAMTCPDAFAWRLFVASVRQGFWQNWSTNRQVWPSDPWPRCKAGETPGQCCPALAISNQAWPEHCPVFPGASPGVRDEMLSPPAVAQQLSLAAAVGGTATAAGKAAPSWSDVPASLKNAVIGGLQGELVYRNRPMVEYIFGRDLYSTDGLARVYDNMVCAADGFAPFWPERDDPVRDTGSAPAIVSVDFPIDSVMIKADWLSFEDAAKVGIDPYDTAHPYIVMNLVPIQDANKTPQGTPAKKPYILLSMHISSKDLPGWFWATFEHVGNQGRCDWIGCNDSFGYLAAAPAIDPKRQGSLPGAARNFTPPHQAAKVAGFDQAAFVLAERYLEPDTMSDGLAAMFEAFGVGSGSGVDQSGVPTAEDAAWRSYRLKGTQTNFVTATGRPTRLGNSVTEAGFVSTSSCITCHARAGATKDGLPPLAIFADLLSSAGLPESENGVPKEAWFNVNAYRNADGDREAVGILAVQTDFVWGFRNACPMKPSFGPSWCKNAIVPPK
jgi:hypothetical protein